MSTTSPVGQTDARWLLAGFLLAAGLAHLTMLREEFQAQVPSWVPLGADLVLLACGAVEVTLATALLLLPAHRRVLGVLVALLFVAVFPGNVAQYVEGTDAFGLDRPGPTGQAPLPAAPGALGAVGGRCADPAPLRVSVTRPRRARSSSAAARCARRPAPW